LKKGHQQEWETRISLLRSLPYFSDYTTKELEQLNATAKLVEYPKNTVSDMGNNVGWKISFQQVRLETLYIRLKIPL